MRVKRLLGVCLVAMGLSGCTLPGAVDRLLNPPQPDPTLLELYAQANWDARTATEPQVAQLRAGDATELAEEIARLCGHYADGTTPPSCALLTTEPAPADFDATTTAAQLLDSLGSLPQESLPIVMDQYLELVALDRSLIDTTAHPLPTPHPEEDLLRQLWETLLAGDYALGVALSAAGGEEYAAIAHTQKQILVAQDYLISNSQDELGYGAWGYEITEDPTPLAQRMDDTVYALTASATSPALRRIGLVTLALIRPQV